MNILVLGYFGYITNQLDGQTVKTRDIYSLISDNHPKKVEYFDTQSFKKSKLNIITMFFKVARADIIFYLPAHNNLKYLFPLIYLIAFIFNSKINYLVVGGWLARFLENKPLHSYLLKRIEGIYVETDTVFSGLNAQGFCNIHKLHNFRLIKYPNLSVRKSDNIIKLLYMARVHPLKGVNLLFDLEVRLKELGMNNIIIDIYGPIFENYKVEFLNKLENSQINYKGILDPKDISYTVTKYDLMLFPTKYYTEGFPGTILDSYICGLPVIATRWLNAEEFIEEGLTGYIVDFGNDKAFIEKVLYLVENPNLLHSLILNIKAKRSHYSADKAWEILKKSIK